MEQTITDLEGNVIKVTDLDAAIRQADAYRNYEHYGASERQLYWHDVYLKLLLTLYPHWDIFHFRLLSFTSSSAWQEIEPIPKILPNKASAIALAKRLARRYKCSVHLSGFDPMDENGI